VNIEKPTAPSPEVTGPICRVPLRGREGRLEDLIDLIKPWMIWRYKRDQILG
jgi:hypothetical protein